MKLECNKGCRFAGYFQIRAKRKHKVQRMPGRLTEKYNIGVVRYPAVRYGKVVLLCEADVGCISLCSLYRSEDVA